MWFRSHQSDTDIQNWFKSKPTTEEAFGGHAVGISSGEALENSANSGSCVECFRGSSACICHLVNLIRGLALSIEPASSALRPFLWSFLSSHKVFLSYSVQGGSCFLQLKMTWPNGHTQICNGTPLANKGSRKLLNKGILILTWLGTEEPCKVQEVWVSCSGLSGKTHGAKNDCS